MENEKDQPENQNTNKEQINISQHDQTAFDSAIFSSLSCGGLHICANKSHGKTRLMFSMAQKLRENPNVRVLIFDGSETFLYAFSKVATYDINDHDVLSTDLKSSFDVEKNSLKNWHLIQMALSENKDLLFRLKTRSPAKRGFAVRSIVLYLDAIQRAEKESTPTHENTKAICYFIDESQNVFNINSQNKTECAEFQTVFSEGRNMKESFFTASQRLTDVSKTIRTKQLFCIGRLNQEDITQPLRKLEKKHGLDFSNMQSRTWFFNDSTFISPEWKQSGKPYIINSDLKQKWLIMQPKEKTLKEKLVCWLGQFMKPQSQRELRNTQKFFESEEENENEEFEDLALLEEDLIGE